MWYKNRWYVSKHCQDLVLSCLKIRPKDRIDIHDILSHPWLASAEQDLHQTSEASEFAKEVKESKTATGEQCKETEDEKDVPSIEVEISTDDNSDDEQLISQLDEQLTAVWKERRTDGDQE